MNGISVIGDFVGETLYYGPGAGGDATASAVVSDIVEIVRAGKSSPMLGFKKPFKSENLKLINSDEIKSKYYLRVNVKDEKGVLGKLAKTLGDSNISIDTFLQKPKSEDEAILLFSTHTCLEREVKAAIKEIESFDFVKTKVSMIRIEE
jgi:homoserine dehydrogenase